MSFKEYREGVPEPYKTERPDLEVGLGPIGHQIHGNPSPPDPAMKYRVPDCGNRLEEFCTYTGDE